MLRYIIVFLMGFSVTYGFNYKFTNPIDMPNTYVASHNEYYIQVDKDLLVVYKDDIAIYHKSFQNCTQIIKSELDSFRIKRFYDRDKIDTILFYSKLELLDKSNRNIGEISISKEELAITYNKKVKKIEFLQPKNDNLLDSEYNLNIEWSSYYGGADDDVLLKITKNSKGDLITGGNTRSSSINGKYPIASTSGNTDIMLMTMSEDGTIKWLTLIGSGNADYMYGLVVDKDDNIWLTGETRAGNFYVRNAIYNNYAGGTADGVVCKFSKDGDVLFSTYMGGNEYDALTDIAYDKDNDRVCCVGRSSSSNFPITDVDEDNFSNNEYATPLVIIDNKNLDLIYSSLFGSQNDKGTRRILGDFVKVDKNGDIVVVGYTNSAGLQLGTNNKYGTSISGSYDSFISKFDSNGKLKWSRYVGGDFMDYASCFTIDNSNNIIVNVITASVDMERIGSSTALSYLRSGAGLDNYLAKYTPEGELIWGGYFGGNGTEGKDFDGTAIIRSDVVVSPMNEIFLTFYTTSTNLKVDGKSIYDRGFGNLDIFLLALDSNSNYLSSTYYGGISDDIPSGLHIYDSKLYMVGYTSSKNFSIINRESNYYGGANDGFIVCFEAGIFAFNPPEIADFQQNECLEVAEYQILDINKSYEFLSLIIYDEENCKIREIEELNSIGNISKLSVIIEKIDNSQSAYYKFGIINFAEQVIVIEDSLLLSADRYLRFEPNDLASLGEHSIYNGQFCEDITIYNDGQSDISLKEAYFKDNKIFSFPTSQLPLVVPAQSSREFTICSYPRDLTEYEVYDTLLIINPCVNLSLPTSIAYYFPDVNSDSKCLIPISINGDIDKYFSTQSIVSNSNYIDIKVDKADDFDITIYNSLSTKIDLASINKSQSNIDIDFANLANGVYFIYLNSPERQQVIRLLLMR